MQPYDLFEMDPYVAYELLGTYAERSTMKSKAEIESKLADFERWLESNPETWEDHGVRRQCNESAVEALRWVLGREAALEPED